VPVVVGSDKPVAKPPTTRLDSGFSLDSSVKTIVSWPAATDASSAIAGYEWQYRKDGHLWSTSRTTIASTRTGVQYMTPGSTYEIRVRARDSVGNWSAWVMSPTPFRAAVVNDRNSSLSYAGSWYDGLNDNATQRTLRHSKKTGSTVRYTFTGRGIAVVAPVSSSRGWLEIRVNGGLLKTVSLSKSSLAHRRIVWAATYSTSGTRTIELRVVRTSDRPLVSMDAFITLK
jgi:hypothetical protein